MPLNGISRDAFKMCSFIPIVRFTIQKDSVIHYRCVTRNKMPTYWQIKPLNCDLKTSSSALLFSGLFLAHGKHSLSVKTLFLRRELSTIFTAEYFLEVILSIYRFKRDNFLSENVIFESKTCIQNCHYFDISLDLTSCECDVRRVELKAQSPPS